MLSPSPPPPAPLPASLNFGLGESVDLLRDTVRNFAAAEIAPLASQLDRDNEFPMHLWPRLGELGLLGITVGADDGGAGMGYLAHVVAMEEISRASASVGLSYGAHSNLCVNQLRRNATAAQKKKFLPGLIAGTTIGALAMSEHNAGSDVVGMSLRAERDGDAFILNGGKMWITNGPDAGIIIVYARTTSTANATTTGGTATTASGGITAFIVDTTTAGFSAGAKLDKLGMRGSNTAELTFTDCRVPAENVLGDVDAGIAILMSGLDYERVVLAGGPLGIMSACMDVALPYVRERRQFGRPIGEFQLMQGKVADMHTAINACRAYVYAVAAACDRGETTRHDAAGAILYAAESATAIALQTIQALGGNGYTNDYPAGRLLRDAKLYEIGAGTSEVRRMLIGRELIADG